MKLKEKIEELFSDNDEINEFMRFTQLGTFLNLFNSGINEFKDEEVKEKFKEFKSLVESKRMELYEIGIN